MSPKSLNKRAFILKQAEQVFIQKGYHGVTMKDIIEQCGISRGGLYLYFSSVNEIFLTVMNQHNQNQSEAAKKPINSEKPFEQLVDEYFSVQKNRLMNREHGLMMAMFDFFLAHKEEYAKDFFFAEFCSSKDIILEILRCGVSRNVIADVNLEAMAENIMFLIQGVSTLAMSSGVPEELIDSQFDFVKKMIYTHQ